MPLVDAHGAMVAMKGSSIADEIEAAGDVLRDLGCGEPEVSVLGEGVLSSTTVAVRVPWADPSRVSWPLARTPQQRRRRPDQTRRKQRRNA